MYTISSLKELLRNNVSVELLCIRNSRLHVEANSLGCIIHPVRAGGYFHPVSILKTSLIIRKNKYSIVHTHASKDLWVIVPALYLLRSTTLLFFTKHIGSGIVKKDFLHRLLYERINKLFAISSEIRENLLQTCPVNEERVYVLPNGIDTNRFNPGKVNRQKARADFKIKEDELVLGMLARFTPGKGHEEFLQAAKELNKEYVNLKYLLVGEASSGEEEYMKKIKALAAEYELPNVLFTGFRGDIPEVLSAMDIFVFPSHSESFGLALIEAMAMKKPSVCTNSGGLLDIAVDNVTSLLFVKNNTKDLKSKIKMLIDSRELRIELGENARKRIIENFDIKKIIPRALNFYIDELKMQIR